MNRKVIPGFALLLSTLVMAGCGMISGDSKIDEGIVIAAQRKDSFFDGYGRA